MGNAPLPRPPAPTERRAVLPIATGAGWFATRLLVHPALPFLVETEEADATAETHALSISIHPTSSSNNTAASHNDAIERRTETTATSMENDNSSRRHLNNDHQFSKYPYPVQFRLLARQPADPESPSTNNTTTLNCILPPDVYDSKLEQLQNRLNEWHAGKLTLILMMFSVSTIIVFVILLAVPTGFEWRATPMVDHPFYVLSIAVGLGVIYSGAYVYIRRQSTRLVEDVEDLFRDWRRLPASASSRSQAAQVGLANDDENGMGGGDNADDIITNSNSNIRGLLVILKRVEHVDIPILPHNSYYDESSNRMDHPNKRRRKQQRRVHNNCFCLVMTLVVAHNSEEDAAEDERGGGTASREPEVLAAQDHDDVVSLGTCNTNESDEPNPFTV